MEDLESLNFPSTKSLVDTLNLPSSLSFQNSTSLNGEDRSLNLSFNFPSKKSSVDTLKLPSSLSCQNSTSLNVEDQSFNLPLTNAKSNTSSTDSGSIKHDQSDNIEHECSNTNSAFSEPASLASNCTYLISNAELQYEEPHAPGKVLARQISDNICEELIHLGQSTRETSLEIMDLWDEKYESVSLTSLGNSKGI